MKMIIDLKNKMELIVALFIYLCPEGWLCSTIEIVGQT
jgi:hypothetical protein